jgi:hypothetical protein
MPCGLSLPSSSGNGAAGASKGSGSWAITHEIPAPRHATNNSTPLPAAMTVAFPGRRITHLTTANRPNCSPTP